MCFDGYITIDSSNPSKSDLYLVDLPGFNLSLLQGLTKSDQADYAEFFETIYKNAQINLKIDLQKKLANRFHIDKKLVTRETSEFKSDVNSGSELAGVKISVSLPKYAKIQILSIGLKSAQDYASPSGELYIYKENADGEILNTINAEIEEGRNMIEVYEEFEDEELFIAYNPADLELYKTKTKYYPTNRSLPGETQDLSCLFPCWGSDEGSIQQINGGGLNVKFIVYCSMEKFLCDNLPLFKYALWQRLGVEIAKEMRVSDRVNRFTILTKEESDDLRDVYSADYEKALDAATINIKITEDPICFLCKSTITSKPNLP